ncbi:DEAD/DEAH box helicase [Candidatus Woesebacteria bacterium]|nr:DEAD/DEAH box helicase [Candidatus Woesebacteria bacterium]
MYTLDTNLKAVHGIGAALQQRLILRNLFTVKDLLLQLPLRYEDRRQILSIAEVLQLGAELLKPITIIAQVKNTSQQWRGRKSIQRATLVDETGQIKVTWFNCPFIIQTLKSDGQFYFSGLWNEKYQTLQQPVVERVTAQTAIHTARLVPLYSSVTGVSSGWMRRIFTNLFDHLKIEDSLMQRAQTEVSLLEALRQLHFPEEPENVIAARQRIALEELLSLMQQADQQKKQWSKIKAIKILENSSDAQQLQTLVDQLPFQLTNGQQQSLQDILADLTQTKPMNRLLQGDVGSGKTVIALLAAHLCITQGNTVCLLAPTRILAQQHLSTTQSLFPNLPCELILGGAKSKQIGGVSAARLYIGTHALVSRISELQPALVIYDEQQRFGVVQRSSQTELKLNAK